MHKRSVIDFPIDENVPCWLYDVASGGEFKREDYCWKHIDVIHGTKRLDLRRGKEGQYTTKLFKDRIIFPYNLNTQKRIEAFSTSKHACNYIINVLGGTIVKDKEDIDEYIYEAEYELNRLIGTEYYLKTILVKAKYKSFHNIRRGQLPFISLKPNLKYNSLETKDNKFILWGKKRLKIVEEELADKVN